MRVTIQTPWIESMNDAELDITESGLIFSYPETYYLDISLKYKVDSDNGKARFVKDRLVLEITLPILGLTDSTKAEWERERKSYDEKKDQLEKSGIQDITDYQDDVAEFKMDGDNIKSMDELKEEALKEDGDPEEQFLKVYDESKVDDSEEMIKKIGDVDLEGSENRVVELASTNNETVIKPLDDVEADEP